MSAPQPPADSTLPEPAGAELSDPSPENDLEDELELLGRPAQERPADYSPTGERIRRRREELGYAQQDLAQRVGVAPSSIHAVETGKRDWVRALDRGEHPGAKSMAKAERLAAALHLEVAALIGRPPEGLVPRRGIGAPHEGERDADDEDAVGDGRAGSAAAAVVASLPLDPSMQEWPTRRPVASPHPAPTLSSRSFATAVVVSLRWLLRPRGVAVSVCLALLVLGGLLLSRGLSGRGDQVASGQPALTPWPALPQVTARAGGAGAVTTPPPPAAPVAPALPPLSGGVHFSPSSAPSAPPAGTSPAPQSHTQAIAEPVTTPPAGGNLYRATVTNTGQTELMTGAASLSSTTAFRIVDDGCAGAHLAPGASCTVTVRYTPPAPGDYSTTLTVPVSGSPAVSFELHGSTRTATPSQPSP